MCHIQTPRSSNHEQLLRAASRFEALSEGDTLRDSFEHIRTLLWALASGALQPDTYALSLSTLNFAADDLVDYETTGSAYALEHIKDKVRTAVGLLP
jgi:hypothetical protein